jgi:hypothetical protein
MICFNRCLAAGIFFYVTAGWAASPLRLTISNGPPLRVTFPTSSNQFYTLQGAESLSNLVWTNIPGREYMPGSGAALVLEQGNPAGASSASGFFRVVESATNAPGSSFMPYLQLEAVLRKSLTQYHSLTNLESGAANETMAQFLAAQPEYEAAGSMPGGAWARMTNGAMVVFDNEDTSTPTGGKALFSLKAGSLGATQPRAKSEFHEIPDETACIYTSFASMDYLETVAGALRSKNYQVKTVYNMTVEDIMNFPQCSVLLLSSHSSPFAFPPMFCVYTATPVTDLRVLQYSLEIVQNKLAFYHKVSEDKWFHFAFTSKGAEAWMKFKKDAFVLLDTCRGGNAVSADFRNALLNNGASVVAGWTWRSFNGMSAVTHSYLFDRMLGANLLDPGLITSDTPVPPKEDPRQRPFTWEALKNDMAAKNLGALYDSKYTNMSKLGFTTKSSSGFGLLAPSIHRVTPRLDKKLQIIGYFGADPGFEGEVDMAGNRLTIKSWELLPAAGNIEAITCDLPSEGAGSVGNVRVTVRNHESNLVPISEYRPTLVYTYTQGGLKIVVTFKVRIRADLHMSRMEAGKAPTPIEILMLADDVTKAEYVCSGSYSDGDSLEEWSGSGTVSGLGGLNSATGAAVLSQADGTLKLRLSAQAWQGLTRKVTELSSGKVSTYVEPVAVGSDTWDGTDSRVGNYVQTSLRFLQASEQYLTIPAKKWTAKAVVRNISSIAPSGSATIELSSQCEPTYPPSKDEPR